MTEARIQALPSLVVNQIAAGEVIERPASVVKELMENAIDAGSTRVDVEIEQSGMDLIRIVDNGSGIHSEDLPLVFTSHATSKLRTADDLFQIGSLGFRGEAMASIGAIAQVSLQTRAKDSPNGSEIHCRAGQLSPITPCNGAIGTRVEVRHLFYSVPVRRKFLKGKSSEMSQISETFIRMALAHLRVHFTLKHNGKLLYEVPSGAGFLDRIGLFFGQEVRDQLLMVEAEQEPYTLSGYVARPSCDRGNGHLQYFFLNGRWIRERLLSKALQEAYRGLMMTGRHPVAFLFLDLPPDHVDVNVHPTKAEVRFQAPERLSGFLQDTIRQRLQGENLLTSGAIPTAPVDRKAPPETAPPKQTSFEFKEPMSEERLPEPLVAKEKAPQPSPDPSPPPRHKPVAPVPQPMQAADRQTAMASPPRKPYTPTTKRPAKAIQLHNKYLAVEVPEGMLLVDQHALHERILYERLKAKIKAGDLDKQQLLIPEPVELTPPQVAQVMEYQQDLADLGLDVEAFGGNTVLLHSYPALLEPKSPVAILQAVVDYLVGQNRPPERSEMLNDLLSLMACHSAVRTGDYLPREVIQDLLSQREEVEMSCHCPHGRPTSLLFTVSDLDKQFRRT